MEKRRVICRFSSISGQWKGFMLAISILSEKGEKGKREKIKQHSYMTFFVLKFGAINL